MTVVALGPEGTFSHELASELFGDDLALAPTIRSVFERVGSGIDRGLVPLENSEAGGVGETLSCLQEFEVFIVGEVFKEIHHHLAGKESAIRQVYAHPQTHEQCSQFIEDEGFLVIHTRSNAESALLALQNPQAGAIIPEGAANRYHLPIIRRDVQNSRHNVTRFVILSSRPGECRLGMKCSILIDPRIDRAGLLYELLGVFAEKSINLTRIESRPSRRGMGSYVFFIDFLAVEGWRECLQQLKKLTEVKELGCYPEVKTPRDRAD
ncbi:MAG: ACT domain-containing protein [Methanomicrobiales archaeon]|nr:ACT domain-containing protein [Methanomicrobiales archaeon]